MGILAKKFVKGIILEGESSDLTDNIEGLLWQNSTSNEIKLYLNSAVRSIITNNQTQTISNKTLDNTNSLTIQDSNLTIQDNGDNTKQLQLQLSGITTSTTRTLTIPDANTTIVGTDSTQTISSKTLDNTNTITIQDANFTLQDNGDNTKQAVFQLSSITTSTTRTITVPDSDLTLLGASSTQTISNKTLDNTNTITVQDANFTIQDNGDNTKQLKIEASGITTSTTRTLTAPDANTTIVGTDATQVLSNKSIIADNSQIVDNGDNTKELDFDLSGATTGSTMTLSASHTEARTLTLPNATDTLVGRSTSDTMTNKTMDGDLNTFSNLNHGAEVDNPSSGVHGVTGSVVGTSDAQVITGKDIDGGTASNSNRITIPKNTKTNLDGLTRKEATLVYATDETKLYVDNGTNLQEIGSGGQGGINYIDNFDFEANTTGWSLYDDGASVEPVDGTEGSPVFLSFLQSPVDPLRGTNSATLVKGAADVRGEGVSYDFDIDNADLAKQLTISFDYDATVNFEYNGGTAGDESDIMVWIYDVTNGALIQPAPYGLDGSGQFVAQFQTAPDSTSYRLIFHIATTNANTWTFKLDNVKVGPASVLVDQGPVTDWTNFTPTGSWVTNTTYTGRMRRVGDSLEAFVSIVLSGAPTTAALTVDLPSGLTIDTDKLGAGSINRQNFGQGHILDIGTDEYAAYVVGSNSTSLRLMSVDNTSGVDLDSVSHANPFTFANNDEINFWYKVPIVGWGSGKESAVAVDSNRPVFFSGYVGSAHSIATASNVTAQVNTVVKDTHGAFNTGTYTWTCPVSGHYEISGNVAYATNSTGSRNGQIFIGGVSKAASVIPANTSVQTNTPISKGFDLQAGDTVTLVANQQSGGNLNVLAGENNSFLTIHKTDTGSPLAALTEKVVAKAYFTGSTANPSIAASSVEILDFDTILKDSHAAITTGASWAYTVPVSGDYEISALIATGSISGTLGNRIRLDVYKGGAIHQYLSLFRFQATAAFGPSLNGCAILHDLEAGDVIDLRCDNGVANTLTLSTTSQEQSHISIRKI